MEKFSLVLCAITVPFGLISFFGSFGSEVSSAGAFYVFLGGGIAYLVFKKRRETPSLQKPPKIIPQPQVIKESQSVSAQELFVFMGKTIPLLLILIAVLNGLFPPWVHTFDIQATHSHRNAGYHFILTPPEPLKDYDKNRMAHGVKIDSSRLTTQWIIIGILAGCWAFRGKIFPREISHA